MSQNAKLTLPNGLWLGRVWRADIGPSLVTLRSDRVIDITTRDASTMRDVLEQPDIAGFISGIKGEDIGSVTEIAAASI